MNRIFNNQLFMLVKTCFSYLLQKWNTFFDPQQVLEQPTTVQMPAFQIEAFIKQAISYRLPVSVQLKIGQDIETLNGQLFTANRQTDAYFMTTPNNNKLTRIIFKNQITAISLNDHPGTLAQFKPRKRLELTMKKTS